MITVELHGLEITGSHGVLDEERATHNTFFFDVWLEVDDAAASDRLDATVDYRRVAVLLQQLSANRRFDLLEALAAAAARAIADELRVESVRVRVRKTYVRELGLPAEYTAATAEARPRA